MAKKRSATIKQKSGTPTKRKFRDGTSDLFSEARLKDFAGIALILCITLIAYYPSLRGAFLLDDIDHLTAPAMQSLQGLWRVWFDLPATQQYYPLPLSAFWIEYKLWGDSVLGYHLINILLHGMSAGLVVLIVRRLRLPGAWLAGFIFALHPVAVEAVAWISAQKSILSAFFYLAAGFSYLRFDEDRKKSSYYRAMGFFVCALLSMSVTATLPVALLVVLWWLHRKIEWKKHLCPLLPWLGLGILAGLYAAWVEKTVIGARGLDFSFGFLQRCLFAGRALWFYLAKLAWPSNLIFTYPSFDIDVKVWWHYLFPASILVIAAFLWWLGSQRRGLLAGWLLFVGTLFPVLGLLSVFRFSSPYVADHFQYLACLGIIVPIASALALASEKLLKSGASSSLKLSVRQRSLMTAAACGLLIMALFVLTWNQSGMYSDAETLWKTTLTGNPGSWVANANLAAALFRQERAVEAMPYAQTALKLRPDSAEANNILANIFRYKQQYDEAIVYYRKASNLRPDIASFRSSIANTLLEMRKIEESVPEFEAALRMDPSDGFLANNLAWILATCPKASVRKGTRALELALKAVQIIGNQDPTVLGTLAAACAEIGRFREAVAIEERAYALAKGAGDAENTKWHAQLLETYRGGKPYREPTLNPE
jgi:protein O-mannosyl-transferase